MARVRFKKTNRRSRFDSLGLRLVDGDTAEVSKELADHLFKYFPDNFETIIARPETIGPFICQPSSLSQISVVAVRYQPGVLERHLLPSLPGGVEFIELDNINNRRWTSIAKALNYGIRKAANDLVVCAHEDVKFGKKWFKHLLQQECRLENWGVLGIMGLDFTQKKITWGCDYEVPKEVDLLDECCLVINRRNDLWFDQKTFTDFHCYGLDLCMQCHNRSLGVYTVAGQAFHMIRPDIHSEAWRETIRPMKRLLRKKWGQNLAQVKQRKPSETKGRVAFIPFRDINAASSRFRCYQNSQELKKLGWSCELGGKNAKIADFVIFQKRYSVSDLNLARQCRGKIILDMCDANWLVGQQKEIEAMAEIADCVTASSAKLASWFRQKGRKAKVIPDGFDFKAIPKVRKEPKPTICWIGDKANEKYLQILVEPLNRLREELGFTLKIIGDFSSHKLPNFSFKPQLVQWRLSTELEEIAKCHVGVAPLFTDEWCSYKGTNKPIAYMALGLPVVATGIDSYQKIITDGKNGFLISENSPEKWYRAIKALVADKTKRSSFIEEGRKTAQAFSMDKMARRWDRLFAELAKS